MAEPRKTRSGRTSTRSREPADQDEQEMPEAFEEDELLDDGEMRDEDEQEVAGEDEMPDSGGPEEADEDEAPADGRRRRPAMSAGEAARAALRQISELTAKQPEGVTEVERTEDGWTVGIELVEDQRIPSSADILATYETSIDADGELQSYRRVRRYARGRGDTEDM